MPKKKTSYNWDFNGTKTKIDFFDGALYQRILDGFRLLGDGPKDGHYAERYRKFFDDIFGEGYGVKLIDEDDSMLALECLASFLEFSFDKMLKVPSLMKQLGAMQSKKDEIIAALGAMSGAFKEDESVG